MWKIYSHQYNCPLRMLRMAVDSVQHACMDYFPVYVHA